MAMKRARLVLLLVATLGGLAVGSACPAHDPCAGGSCGCEGGSDCALECNVSPCELECGEVSSCEASCRDDCTASCRDLSDCTLECDEGCTLTCDRLSNCSAACGARCDYACRDVSNCEVTVGPDSVVACARVSNCQVECHGPCRVECDSVSNCDVGCFDLQGTGASSPAQDADGTLVCE
jgi:hypothetical protein